MKKIIGTVITLVIGGTVYTFSQADLVKNFSKDTGLSQQEAQQYVDKVREEDLMSFGEMGSEFISDGQDLVDEAKAIDCVNYKYEWESYTLSCWEGKSQLRKLGNSEISLGKAYKALEADDAGEAETVSAIQNIDRLNSNLSLDIVTLLLDPPSIDELRKTNSYNKALLKSALESK